MYVNALLCAVQASRTINSEWEPESMRGERIQGLAYGRGEIRIPKTVGRYEGFRRLLHAVAGHSPSAIDILQRRI